MAKVPCPALPPHYTDPEKRLALFTNEEGEEWDVYAHGQKTWVFVRRTDGLGHYIMFGELKEDARKALGSKQDFDARTREDYQMRQTLSQLEPE